MWISWGDDFGTVLQDRQTRTRKTKYMRYVLMAVVFGLVLPSNFVRMFFRHEGGLWPYVPAAMILLAAVICFVLFWVKWAKNDRECDLALILATLLFAFCAYYISPYNMPILLDPLFLTP